MKTERGDFHRRNRRGGAPPFVAGAGLDCHRCAFCRKQFRSEVAVRDHERNVHKKRIKNAVMKRLQRRQKREVKELTAQQKSLATVLPPPTIVTRMDVRGVMLIAVEE